MRENTKAPLAFALLEFSRLERKRSREGLTVRELEERDALNRHLNSELPTGIDERQVERRRSVRIPTKLRCRFGNLDIFEDALITSLSGGGIFIATTCPLPVGSRLDVQISIDESNAEVEVPGVVVSNHVEGQDPARRRSGLRFTEVLP